MSTRQLGLDLSEATSAAPSRVDVPLAPGAVALRAFAYDDAARLLSDIEAVSSRSPFRHMITPGGFRMSVAMTNCGALGWVTDERGYRYAHHDPLLDAAWPAMPESFQSIATRAAAQAGFANFHPDACLINRYEVEARMTLHQDKNEHDYTAPIVSVSLGLPVVFQFGGATRKDRTTRVTLHHGDVVVWGGDSRLNFHGVLPLKEGHHPLVGARRFNLTFRKAGKPV